MCTRFGTMQGQRGLKRDIRKPLIATYDGPLRPLGYLAIRLCHNLSVLSLFKFIGYEKAEGDHGTLGNEGSSSRRPCK
jgi:hypothetical protein